MQGTSYGRRLAGLISCGRRARMVAIGSLVLTPAVAMANPTAALATSGVKCADTSTYGSQCIDVHGTGYQVTDIQSWFLPPNADYLTGRTWNTELTSYSCDPRGLTKTQCPPSHTWYSKSRSGNPPKSGSTCTSIQSDSFAYQQCVDYGVGYADADFGDWPTFYSMPHTFSSATWLCTELSVWNGSRWVDNGAAGSKGVRACAEVY